MVDQARVEDETNGGEGERSRPWRVRIVAEDEVDPRELRAHSLNWREHPPEQREAMVAIFDKVGWLDRVVWNRRTDNLINGHLRVDTAIERGEPTVPRTIIDIAEDEEPYALATFDTVSGMAEIRPEQLLQLIELLPPPDEQPPSIRGLLGDLGQQAQDRLMMLAPPPDLDALAEQYGEPDDQSFWPVIRLRVPPETQARYDALLKRIDGEAEHERFAAFVELAETAFEVAS